MGIEIVEVHPASLSSSRFLPDIFYLGSQEVIRVSHHGNWLIISLGTVPVELSFLSPPLSSCSVPGNSLYSSPYLRLSSQERPSQRTILFISSSMQALRYIKIQIAYTSAQRWKRPEFPSRANKHSGRCTQWSISQPSKEMEFRYRLQNV